MKRLYKTYAITVTKDGEKKIIKLNGNVNSSNYKTMVDTYKKTKEKFSNEDCTVELVGVNEDETLGNTIFSKQFCQEKEDNSDLLTPTDDIITEIKYLFELLQRKQGYHYDMVAATSKEEDVLLHRVENFEAFEGKEVDIIKEKLFIFNNIQSIRKSRRFHKSENGKLNSINDCLGIASMVSKLEVIKVPVKQNYLYLNDLNADKLSIFKKLSYNTDKERVHYMKQMEGKYKKVVNDYANKTLIFYNNAKND